ncbi:MAG TPA: hypothetical protein DCF48_06350, partial [Rikenellaceae bacterium]|nr:hypothetical protein [Rikenellaceae bacterium]
MLIIQEVYQLEAPFHRTNADNESDEPVIDAWNDPCAHVPPLKLAQDAAADDGRRHSSQLVL